jgi:KDO2-lipid IV(A) lauroyltransferase
MTFQHRIEYFGVLVITWIARALPQTVAIAMGRGIGWFAYAVLGIRRSVTQDNLRKAFPDKPERWIRQTAKVCYQHFGRVGVELARLPKMDIRWIEKNVDFQGRDVLDRSQARGKGAVVMSGHIGNWEIMGATVAMLGYPATYIVTTQRNKAVEQWMDNLRSGRGIEIIKTHDNPIRAIRALKKNRIIAVLSDQDAHEDGAFVPFFGRLASTPRGGAVLQLKTDASPIFCLSTGLQGGKWRITLEDIPSPGEDIDKKDAEIQLLTYVTKRLEEEIRKRPEQWLWMHRRWKTQPPKPQEMPTMDDITTQNKGNRQ